MQFNDRKSLKKCDEQFTPSTSFNAFRSVVRQRQAADGVNHAVQESSERNSSGDARKSRCSEVKGKWFLDDWIRSTRSFTRSPLLTARERKQSSEKARCTRSCSRTSYVMEESCMNEKLNKSTFLKLSPTWSTKRRNEESSHKLKSS